MQNKDLSKIHLNLPTYNNELSKAEDYIEKLKKKVDIIVQKKSINNVQHTQLFDEIIKVLLYVGHLSEPCFEVEEKLKEEYLKKYIHSPALAKQLWLQHYEEIHHPYSLLKNRCFRLIDELDKEYYKTYKKSPPNWNL